MLGYVGHNELQPAAGRAVPQRPGAHARRAALGHRRALPRRARRASPPRCAQEPALASIGIDSWAVDYGLLRDGRLLGEPVPLPRRAHRARRRGGARARAARASSTPRTACSSCRSTRCTSYRRPTAGRLDRGRRAFCSSPTWSPSGSPASARRRAHQRLDHRPARRRRPASGTTSSSTRLGLPRGIFPALVDAGHDRRAARCPAVAASVGAGRRRGDRRRVARHGIRCRRRAGDHATTSPTSPAAPGAWSASSSSSPVLTEASRARELHQRGRRRRPRALPAQRDGPVAAQRVGARVGGGRRSHRPRRRCSPQRPQSRRRCRSSTRTTRASCARRHARAHRRMADRARAAGAAQPRGVRAQHPREPRGCLRHGRAHGRRAVGQAPCRSSTSSAADRRTSCSASSPPTAAGLPVLAGPVEATAIGNVLVQARAQDAVRGDLETLRALVAAAFRPVAFRPVP